ncbi:MAG TPA: hypothetical protein VGI28_17250 [Stellaceae bacterium]|jgi:hypothetical protein
MREAYLKERRADAGARTEPQRGFEMLDRNVLLARVTPQDAAHEPAAREVRVKRQRAVTQRDHRADVLAEPGQRTGGIHQDARVVAGHFQGPPLFRRHWRRCLRCHST